VTTFIYVNLPMRALTYRKQAYVQSEREVASQKKKNH